MGWLNNLINKAKKRTEETVQGAVQQGQQVVQNAVQNVSSGYGDWLNGVEQQVTPIVQNAVQQGQQAVQGVIDQGNQAIQQGVQYTKDAAGNLVEQATPVVQNAAQGAIQQGQQAVQGAIQQGQQAVQGAVEQGQQIVQNTVQNASQAVTDKVNDINNQIQGNTTPQPPAAAVPTTQNNQVPTATPVTTPTQTTPTVQQQTPTNTPTQENSTFAVDEPILSYEDYLKKESEGLGYIKDKVTQQTDQQSADNLKHIDEALASGNKYAEDVKSTTDAALEAQKQADVAYAESQRDLMKDTSQAERDAVYKYAEETLAGALGYNQEAYGKLVEAITGQMEAGKLAASEAKNLLMIMAEESKNTTYGAAERQRQEAERQADINRQRAIADANSAYEQNKASYGAKAEALGNMGLTAGGYGDWLNASAYAQNRSEVQGARAQSDAAKREAKYTEDMTKLQADQEYSNKKYQAESDYQSKLYDIDTSYRANLSEAEQSKLAADKAAQDAERETKQSADSKHRENVYNAESTYGEWLNKAETAEREGKLQSDIKYKGFLYETEQEAKDQKLQVNQDAANKKLQAEISYVEGILGNSKALAEYKESLKAGDAAAEERRLALYEQVLTGASNGTYDAETAAALADAFGFGDDWKNEIANAVGRKKETDAGLKAEADAAQNKQDYTSVLVGVANGELDEATATALAKEYGFSQEQTDAIIKVAQGRASGETGDMFIDTLINASNGKLDEATATAIAKQYGFDEEQTNAVVKAAQGAAGKVQKEQKTQNFNSLLERGKTGALTAEEITAMATELGFDVNNPDDKKLIDLAVKAADNYKAASDEEKQYQKSMNALTVLDGAKNGTYTADEIPQIAAMLGLDAEKDAGIIKMLTDAANGYSNKTDDQMKTNAFINLLGSANNGELTKDELNYLAGKMGLGEEEIGMLNEALDRAASGDEAAINAAKAQNFGALLNGAKTGAYGADEVEAMATMLGLDPEKDKALIDMLTGAVEGYESDKAAAITKSEEAQKTSDFITLLGSAGSGELTKEEVMQIAEMLGFDPENEQDAELLDLIGTAADRYASGTEEELKQQKTMNFISLLDGANTGAYGADQIEKMATMLGLDPNNEADAELIDMLKTAATDFANGEAGKTAKEDMQYQNAIYSELLAAANNGDYTEKQIKALAERFGIEDTDDILAEAARLAQEGKDKTTSENSALNIIDLKDRGYITSDTTDDEIQDYIDAGLIAEGDLEKVKEERTKMATSEVEDLIESGNYDGAIKRAEELYADGTGTIDVDTYQNAYFEATVGQTLTEDNKKDSRTFAEELLQHRYDLTNLYTEGKISRSDYDALWKYAVNSAVGRVDCSVTARTANDGKITIGETEHTYKLGPAPDDTTQSMLDLMLDQDPNNDLSVHTVVKFDNTLYMYCGNSTWRPVKNTGTIYSNYEKLLGYQPKIKAPKHESNEKTETPNKGGTSSGGGAGGGSGGGGKYGVNYVKD